MTILKPIFDERVWEPVWLADTEQASDTDTLFDGNNVDTLALNPPENPFRSLMNKVRELLETGQPHDMRHALYMVNEALTEGKFSSDQEHLILADHSLEIQDMIKDHDRENAPFLKTGISPAPHYMV